MKHDHHHHISRRKFFGQASCAAVGATTMLSTLVNLKSMGALSMDNSLVAGSGDYKALVCFMMEGGNDSFNMLVPTNPTAYNTYAGVRSNLALPLDNLLPLNGTEVAVHPSMTGVQSMFNEGKLSFISNIGTLIEPVTKEDAWNDDSKLPLGLFSHSDQTRHWQTGLPHERSPLGWGGRVADLINDMNSNEKISMNMSLNGSNIFQTGTSTLPYTLDREQGSIGIIGYNDNGWLFEENRTKGINNMLEAQYDDLFKKTYVDVIKTAVDADQEIKSALESLPGFATQFSNNELSQSFEMVAKMMSIRETLGMQRQIFFVSMGGWDHHDEVLNAQDYMLGRVSDAMTEFNQVLEEMGLSDCVTTFSVSEFGRTLTSNGNGTDHGWGGNVMVMGGSVKGGRVFGTYPDLALGSDLELGGGVYIPTTSCDEYFAELAMWLGVAPSSLLDIFPNIGNFYDTGSGSLPLGFMDI